MSNIPPEKSEIVENYQKLSNEWLEEHINEGETLLIIRLDIDGNSDPLLSYKVAKDKQLRFKAEWNEYSI